MKIPLLALTSSLMLACGSSSPPADSPGPKPVAEAPPAGNNTPAAADTFAAQVERGGKLYGANCAKCHGAGGEGSDKAPAVVGDAVLPLDPRPGAKRDVQFQTALDVFMWVKKTMPADKPGSLTDAEYVDILAFDLKANGVDLQQPLDGEVAKTLKLH